MNKVVKSAAEAVRDVPDGATVMVSGFGLCGAPENLIFALRDQGATGLTVVSNNAGVTDFGVSFLLKNGQVRKMIATYVGENKVFEAMFLDGSLEVELNPQGTFAGEDPRGRGRHPRLLHPRRLRHRSAEGKEVRWFDGNAPRHGDGPAGPTSALVKAWKGDTAGNLVFRRTAPQLRPDDVPGRAHDHRRGRAPRPRRRHRPRRTSTRRASSSTASSRARAGRGASSGAPLRGQGRGGDRPEARPDRRSGAALEMKDGDYVEPRHRHAHPGRELRARRASRSSSTRERDAGRGPLP